VRRYETVDRYEETLQSPYTELATMLKCSLGNIAILQSATAAWMQVTVQQVTFTEGGSLHCTSLIARRHSASRLPRVNCDGRRLLQVFYGIPFQQGDRILTGIHEYGANYIAFLQVWNNSFLMLLAALGVFLARYITVWQTSMLCTHLW
jgi:hypothetical protein